MQPIYNYLNALLAFLRFLRNIKDATSTLTRKQLTQSDITPPPVVFLTAIALCCTIPTRNLIQLFPRFPLCPSTLLMTIKILPSLLPALSDRQSSIIFSSIQVRTRSDDNHNHIWSVGAHDDSTLRCPAYHRRVRRLSIRVLA